MDIKGDVRPQRSAPVIHALALQTEKILRSFLTIIVLIALGLVAYSIVTSKVPIGSRDCGVSVNLLDRNQDGVVSVSEPGAYLVSAFASLRKTLHSDERYESALTFMELKKGQCTGFGSVIMGAIAAAIGLWFITTFGVIVCLLAASAFAGINTGRGPLVYLAPRNLVPKGLTLPVKQVLLFSIAMGIADLLVLAQVQDQKQPPKGSATIKPAPRQANQPSEKQSRQTDTQKQAPVQDSKSSAKSTNDAPTDVKGLVEAKQKCSASGLTPGTEPFGKCVVQELLYSPAAAEMSPEQAARAAKGN